MATKNKQKDLTEPKLVEEGIKPSKNNKTIVLPIAEADYETFVENKELARCLIENLVLKHQELFPSEILERGFSLKGKDRISKYRKR